MPPPGVCLNILGARNKQDGRGTVSNPEKLLNQDYQQLKQCCLTQRVRYIDDMFPPNRRSIGEGLLAAQDLSQVVWLRPSKIVPNAFFVLDGVSRFDFGQGILGNCWFLASIGALTFQNQVLAQVVPLEQTFDENYCGLFHFRFWRFGRWVDVVIDDKLPTINGRLIFVHSKKSNEFWPALLEKAYAKVCGSYADMTAGTPAEAMLDFTGGVHTSIQLSNPPSNLWELLFRAGRCSSLMGCGTAQGETPENTVLPNGLVQGHAYTITGVKQLMSRGQAVNLVRLWNPWGKREWIGDWSDKSPLWQTVSPQDREMCLAVDDDGEFCLQMGLNEGVIPASMCKRQDRECRAFREYRMAMQDFCKFYEDLDICCVTPDFLDQNSAKWNTSTYEGRWVAGTTAGGCMNNRDSYWTNPQYRIKIECQHSESDGEKNMLVSLMQKPDKRNRRLVQNLHIGFSVFEVTEQYKTQKGKFPASFFNTHSPVAQTKTYVNARDVVEFLHLKPAEYLIVPSTFNANETASFLLTIHSKTETHGYENSGHYNQEPVQRIKLVSNTQEDDNKRTLFHQYSDKYDEVDAEQLQSLLNENILKGDLKSGGFSIDASRSMVALMDTSITGKLNSEEFLRLWRKIVAYKDIFFKTDVSRTGTLSLSELRNAFVVAGINVSDEMLNLMALRYGASTGHMTLESFIGLILRVDCMFKIFNQLSDGKSMNLQQSEWLYISLYT